MQVIVERDTFRLYHSQGTLYLELADTTLDMQPYDGYIFGIEFNSLSSDDLKQLITGIQMFIDMESSID